MQRKQIRRLVMFASLALIAIGVVLSSLGSAYGALVLGAGSALGVIGLSMPREAGRETKVALYFRTKFLPKSRIEAILLLGVVTCAIPACLAMLGVQEGIIVFVIAALAGFSYQVVRRIY
jgi:hypothetical protein